MAVLTESNYPGVRVSNPSSNSRTIVVSGGTDGMGRATALARARRGDRVLVIGSNPEKGAALTEQAGELPGSIEFVRADLSSVEETDAAAARVLERAERIDALALFANRQAPKRVQTSEGLERTFALYYLSRYILGGALLPALARSSSPVVINVAGVGMTRGSIHWDDLQLVDDYDMIAAQLQAGRANDLLGVHYAATHDRIAYVLYHPGFTRSGDLTSLSPVMRAAIRAAARISGRPIEKSIAPVLAYIGAPPQVPLTARDRNELLPLSLPTLDPALAQRLAALTEELLASVRGPGTPG